MESLASVGPMLLPPLAELIGGVLGMLAFMPLGFSLAGGQG